jgi:hypothetical protein
MDNAGKGGQPMTQISKETLEAVIQRHSSPAYDRGDAHGAKGQRGYIVWESEIGFIAANLASLPHLRPAPSHSDDPFAGERLSFCTRIADLLDQIAAKDAEIEGLQSALTEVRDKVALHAHAIAAEVRLIHDYALNGPPTPIDIDSATGAADDQGNYHGAPAPDPAEANSNPDFHAMVDRLLFSRSWPHGVMPNVAIAEYAFNLGCLCKTRLIPHDTGAPDPAEAMRDALEPFATFGLTDDQAESDIRDDLMSDRICDWFGPSDFDAARAALKDNGDGK